MATDDEVAVVVDVRAGVGWVWKRPGDEKVAGFLITNTRTVRMTVRLQPQFFANSIERPFRDGYHTQLLINRAKISSRTRSMTHTGRRDGVF
jgi:hypothetical protein